MKEWLDSVAALSPWVYAPALSLGWVMAAFLIKRILVQKLLCITEKTPFQFDDLLVKSVSKPLGIVILASGILMLTRMLPFNAAMMRFFFLAFQLMTIFSVVLFLDTFFKGFLELYSLQIHSAVSPRAARFLIRTFLFSIGILIFLDLIGISVTPILASLGIGSLAVGLALQETLSNFFSGVHLSIDKPIRVGDLVKLESGDEGFVTEIGWRSTRIRTGQNNLVVIPNQKLTGSVITNYFMPDKETAVILQLGIDYGTDLDRAEKIILEVAREVMKKSVGGVPHFEPAVRFHTFGPFSIQCAVTLRSREPGEQPLVKHEFVKALHARFKKEGIVIPYPHTTLDIPKDSIESLKVFSKV